MLEFYFGSYPGGDQYSLVEWAHVRDRYPFHVMEGEVPGALEGEYHREIRVRRNHADGMRYTRVNMVLAIRKVLP